MRCLLAHNAYQRPGGEDEVFRSEKALLCAAGHEVIEYVRCNDEIQHYGFREKATLGLRTVWARDSERDIREILRNEKPQIAHFHNTFPLISPAAYYACHEAGVPVVQTLHNYRLYCPAATFLREDHICEECIEHSLFRSIRYGCYRESRAASGSVATMLQFHRLRRTWEMKINVYICLTAFQKDKLVGAGLPADRIMIKPNFVPCDPAVRSTPQRGPAVFAGRLSAEKGLFTLLKAWQKLKGQVPLRIVGDGPMRRELERTKNKNSLSNVSFEGYRLHESVITTLRSASFLLFPSLWYECFPVTLVEAFACGVPVIASRLGAMAEIVEDGCTGLHFRPGDPNDLAEKVEWAWTHPQEMEEMGRNARAEYEKKYTAQKNYQILMQIYQRALE